MSWIWHNSTTKQIKVNIPKWKGVSELTFYFENEEADHLEIKGIEFYGSPGNQNVNIGELKKNESSNLGIIMEEPDKTKEGYDPSSNLQQTLDSVVIKKNKKKKKLPSFDG